MLPRLLRNVPKRQKPFWTTVWTSLTQHPGRYWKFYLLMAVWRGEQAGSNCGSQIYQVLNTVAVNIFFTLLNLVDAIKFKNHNEEIVLVNFIKREPERVKSRLELGPVRKESLFSTVITKFGIYEVSVIMCYIVLNVHLMEWVKDQMGWVEITNHLSDTLLSFVLLLPRLCTGLGGGCILDDSVWRAMRFLGVNLGSTVFRVIGLQVYFSKDLCMKCY